MSKDRISRSQGLGSAPESDMSDELLASHSPFQSALIAAGREDGLRPDRREKLVRSLSIAVGLPESMWPSQESWPQTGPGPHSHIGGTAQAPAALSTTAKVAGVKALSAKVLGGVALTGALVWSGWQVLGSTTSAPAPSTATSTVAVQQPESGFDVEPMENADQKPVTPSSQAVGEPNPMAPEAPLDENAAEGAARPGRSKAKVSDSLAKELSLIDSARAALLRGEPAAALRILNTYRSQFPRGALQAEATVQRVEALIAAGDRTSASTIGGAFLKRYPESPYSRRILSLLGGGREPQVDGARKSK